MTSRFPRFLLLISASLLLATMALPLFADSVVTKERQITKIGEGVYVIRHPDAPDAFPQGNTTVIIGEKAVFVVDSCYLPSAAQADIAQIRQWTTKPVQYLLNTHWHFDHTMGNAAYVDAFPSIAVIAQLETQKQIAGYNPGWFERYPTRAERFQKQLDAGKDADGKPLSESDKKDLKDAIAGVVPVGAEFKTLPGRLTDLTPNVAFDRELDIDLGNREVAIKFLGKGNTAGDAVVYLPKEKIVVAGDLLDHPVPYLGGGYPFQLVTTLQTLAQLDANTIVPGHGDVMHDKVYLNDVIDFIRAVTAKVHTEIYRVGNGSKHLDEVQKAVVQQIDLAAWEKKFGGDDKDNRDFLETFSFPGLITAAYAEDWPK